MKASRTVRTRGGWLEVPVPSQGAGKVAIVAVAILTGLLGRAPATAVTNTYQFLPEQSSVLLSGGFGGHINETHSIQGSFQMTVDYEALTASFDQVNASLSPGGAYLSEHDLGTLFYMTELVGSVAIPTLCDPGPIQINFQGQSHGSGPADYIDGLLNIDGSLQLTGSFWDGNYDGMFYNLDAIAMPALELTVATDKPSYSFGEDITVSVTAYNPNDYEVTLEFGSTLQASYIMDDVYDWSSDGIFLAVVTEVTVGAQSSYNWDLEHDWEYTVGPDTYGYDLSIGTHSVVGALQPVFQSPGDYTYYSQAVEFEVVPVPGDVNGDGYVGGVDLTTIITNWGMNPATRLQGDLDGDGTVSGPDYTEVITYWGTGTPPSEPGPTPEPATLALILVGCLILLKRRK